MFSFAEGNFFRHLINSALTKRVTSYNSAKSKITSPKKAVFFIGFNSIARTGWIKAARSPAFQRRNILSVQVYKENAEFTHLSNTSRFAKVTASCFSISVLFTFFEKAAARAATMTTYPSRRLSRLAL